MAEEAEESDVIFVVMRSPLSGAKFVRKTSVVQEPKERAEEDAGASAQQK